jgi:hypothetical protein
VALKHERQKEVTMTLDRDLMTRATQPGHSSMMLLHEMTGTARTDVVGQLAQAIVHADALALADYLAGDPMAKAKEAAAEPEATVAAATKALAKEEHALTARLAAFFKRKLDGSGTPGEREPDRDTPQVQALKTALYAAERESFPLTNAVTILEEQINGLRATPAPDPAILAVLAEALIGGHKS